MNLETEAMWYVRTLQLFNVSDKTGAHLYDTAKEVAQLYKNKYRVYGD